MAAQAQSDVTTLLEDLHPGNPDAQSRLLDLVYGQLRTMAADHLARERSGHSWQSSDLVNEAVLRLLDQDLRGLDRSQFFGRVSRLMGQLLVDHVRFRNAQRRGRGWQRMALDDVADYFERARVDVTSLNEALDCLATSHERQSQVIRLLYFGRFTVAEVTRLLGISESTVERDLKFARAWLHKHMTGTRP